MPHNEQVILTMAIRLILFDIDGTLLHAKGAGRASTRAAMQEVFGTAGDLDGYSFLGKTDWSILVDLLGENGYSPSDIERLMPAYEESIARHLGQLIADYAVEPCGSALEVVRDLQSENNRLLGLVTGNVSSTAPIKLRAAGFDPDWFRVGGYGNESGDRDELAALALERAKKQIGAVIPAEEIALVGDTPSDVHSARALGALAVAVTTGFASREALVAAQPDHLLDDLSALPSILAE
jgi:phosphoglycolate phosphatase-like HAD superfamily hydrolase